MNEHLSNTHASGEHLKTRFLLDDLRLLRAFVAVVETHSFTSAGKRLNVVPSTISKHISALEDRLSGQMIIRSTKNLSVTELGTRFYQRCVSILKEVEAAEFEVVEYNGEPQGLLKVSAAPAFTTHRLEPIVSRFLTAFPQVVVEVSLTSVRQDLISTGIDVAIRISSKLDPSLIALRLAPNTRVYCAAPSYLAKYGTPRTPAELLDHNCLVMQGVYHSAQWPFKLSGGKTETYTVDGNLMTDNAEFLHRALLSGLGIGLIARFMVFDNLVSGELVELFPESRYAASNIYAVYPERRNLPLKTRAFLDHLRSEFRVTPDWAAE